VLNEDCTFLCACAYGQELRDLSKDCRPSALANRIEFVSPEKFTADKLTVKEQPSASRSELQLHILAPSLQ
jgi:hypothetical protein